MEQPVDSHLRLPLLKSWHNVLAYTLCQISKILSAGGSHVSGERRSGTLGYLIQPFWICRSYLSPNAAFRAASNSSPGVHAGSFGSSAITRPASKPSRASSIMPSKFQSGVSSSLGWW